MNSKASKTAAANRWALTEQEALDMNLHLCSWAPAVPVEVNKCAFMEIWDHNGAGSYAWRNPWKDIDVQIFDERCLPHIDNSDVLWEQAMNPCTHTATTATTTTTNASQSRVTAFFGTDTTEEQSSSGSSTNADSASTSGTAPFGDAAETLAFTGASALPIASAGLTMAGMGAGLLLLARRRREAATTKQVDAADPPAV